jgi:predicted PurR-regulated permease PerM
VNPRLHRVLLWFGMAAVGIVGLALRQEVLAPFAAAFAFACLPRPAADRLELYGTRRRCADLAA